MPAAVDHIYRYRQPSIATGQRLGLVTSLDHPTGIFFTGNLLDPRRTADFLLALTRTVASRFHVPAAMLGRILLEADPVVTCHSSLLRFEGFSSCGSTYARLDLSDDALDGRVENTGTTNVDFGPSMRAALAALRTTGAAALTIGKDLVELRTPSAAVIERKVKLPLRWVKGFAEAALYQAEMIPWNEVSGAVFRRFLTTLPASSKGEWSIAGPNLRLSQTDSAGSLRLGGIARLRLLEPVARHAQSVRIYSAGPDATAWELHAPGARFTIVLSGDVWRGFSGEGRVLSGLARKASAAGIAETRASLRWQSTIPGASNAATAHCAAAGLLGFDLSASAWFHRELPYRIDAIDRANPRLAAARALADEGAVLFEDGRAIAWVRSQDVEHRVTLEPQPACTCVWFNKHGARRGPCKHVLAATILRDDS